MHKHLSALLIGALAFAACAGAATREDRKLDAALKAVRTDSLCSNTVRELSYAMPYARSHGISQADAVVKIQTIAAEKNKPLIRYMAINSYFGTDDTSKADLTKYCIKQLSKQTWDEVSNSGKILDGGDALTLFVPQ